MAALSNDPPFMSAKISLLTIVGPRGRTIKTSTKRLRGVNPSPSEWRRLAGYHPEINQGRWVIVARADV